MLTNYESLLTTVAEPVWRHFAALSKIPRPSRHEEQVQNYLLAWAQEHGWQTRQDDTGNLNVLVPGRGKLAGAPTLVIQAHTDMVCEKNADCGHDFMKDPIRLQRHGDWVSAIDTTLGADNGIAVAMMMAVVELPLPHRLPLELLFTVDEETGLTGAINMNPEIVTGRYLLNMDSEEDATFTIGCSGGIDMKVRFPRTEITHADGQTWQIHIKGFRGGHSGVNIHESRLNAIRSASQFLTRLHQINPTVKLLGIKGGDKKNAIPRECVFTVINALEGEIAYIKKEIIAAVLVHEPKAEIEVLSIPRPDLKEIPFALVEFLTAIPNGVIAMDPHFPDLVQTSSSVGVIQANDHEVDILLHGRSSEASALDALSREIEKTARKNHADISFFHHYPGWQPNPDSVILKYGRYLFNKVFGREPAIKSIHAGLESGILGQKLNTRELLAIGPTITNAHSPTEKVEVNSVANVFKFLTCLVSDPDALQYLR